METTKRIGEGTRLGLALGSGGARGLASCGVLKVLEREGLHLAAIAGTSMGAIVGALYAELLQADQVAERLRQYIHTPAFQASWKPFAPNHDDESHEPFAQLRRNVQRRVLEFRTLTSPAHRTANDLLGPLERLFHTRRIEDLKLPFAAVATDLNAGEVVVFDEGELLRAIYASSAIPGIFPPLEAGGRLLVDGGIASRVPVDVCRSMNVDFVIAVHIPSFTPNGGEYRTGFDVILRGDEVTRKRLGSYSLREADFVVRPDVAGFHWADFASADEILRAGEQAMEKALPELERALERPGALGWLREVFDRVRTPKPPTQGG